MSLNFDAYNVKSIPFQFRKKRFEFFTGILDTVDRPLRILDVGGTESYWDSMDFSDSEVHVTLCNLFTAPVKRKNFTSIAGDATNLKQYKDKEFDLVFSNSVIEHLYTWENQIKMAKEIRRVGKRYYVQTPNYYFPVEPHWLFPLFHYLPKFIRVSLTHKYTLGHMTRSKTRAEAIDRVNEVRLLTGKEMRQLFPEAKIYNEKIFGLTKSITAYYFP